MSPELIPTETLIDELFSRFDVAVFGGLFNKQNAEMEHAAIGQQERVFGMKPDGTDRVCELSNNLFHHTLRSMGEE